MPDLFVGRPVVMTGKLAPGTPNEAITVRVTGKVGGEQRVIEIPVNLADDSTQLAHAGVPAVWARMKIADLAERATYEPGPGLPMQVRQVAMEYGLMSAYTAFVAVDSSGVTTGDHGVSVAVPIPVPDGVRYDTTVTDAPGGER